MKKNYLLLIITTFLFMFITVSYAAFSRDLLITGEGSILKDNTPPTCGAWYLRDSSLTIQEAYNQNKFINPGTNDTWTNTNKKLFIECTDNMAGDLGCINVTEITDSNNQKRYFKEVIEYTTTTQTDSNIITVTLQDAFLNQTTCTLPVGGSNPYIDKQGPTVTITQSAANKFTYSATDDIGVTGYMVTTTSTVPALDNANWVSTPSEVTIDNTTSKTYYVWAKDEANVTNSTINTYLLTKTEGTGTTLTLRYNNSSGTILNTGYVLNGTPVYVSGALKPGYNSITLTKTTSSISVINNNTTQTINSNTTITSGSTANTYTVTANANGGTIPTTSGWSGSGSTSTKSVTYNSVYGTLPTPTRSKYLFSGWSREITTVSSRKFTDSNSIPVVRITPSSNDAGGTFKEGDVITFDVDVVGATITGIDINDVDVSSSLYTNTGTKVSGTITITSGMIHNNYDFIDIHCSTTPSSFTVNTFKVNGIVTSDSLVKNPSNHTITATWEPLYTEFDTGQNVNQKMKRLTGNSSATANSTDTNITSIVRSSTEPSASNKTEEHIVSSSDSKYPIYMWYDNGIIYWWSEESNPYFNADSSQMFNKLQGMSSLDLSPFNTSNVTNMYVMFWNCSGLTSLNLSSFDTSNVTDMESMFDGCSSLISLDLSSFNTSKVEYMSYMFYKCNSLTSLDLSSFNMNKVDLLYDMLTYMSGLQSLKTPNTYPNSGTIDLPRKMFDSNNNGYFTLTSSSPTSTWLEFDLTEFDTGQNVNQKMKRLAGNSSADEYSTDTNITTIVRSSTEPSASNKTEEHIVSSNASKYPIYMWYDNGIMYWWSEESNPYFNTDSSYMFNGLQGMPSLDLSSFDTSNVNNMFNMFYNCSSLTNVDLSSFDTSNVTNMYGMFNGCSGLTSLNISSFNTSNVTNMNYMFYNCSSLTSLNVSSFNTSNVTSMGNMFRGCSKITSLDLSNFTISSSKMTSSYSLNYMLTGMSALKKLKTPSTYTANYNISLPKTMYTTAGTAYSSLTKNTPKNTWLASQTVFDTGPNVNVKMKKLAGNSSANKDTDDTNITTIIRSSTEPTSANKTSAHVVSASSSGYPIYMWYDNGTMYWWSECTKPFLNSNSSYMFYRLYGLNNLNLSPFVTSSVTNMSSIFARTGLTNLDLTGFNTNNVTNMTWMFQDSSNLTSLDLSSFNTSKVTDMRYMFYNCSSLTSLDLSSFNTSNVTDMSYMFQDCSSLTTLDLSSFNMNKLYSSSMTDMLTGMSGLQSLKTPNTYPSSGTINLPRKMLDSSDNEYFALTSSSPTSTWLEYDSNITEFDTGENVNQKMKRLAGDSSATYTTQDTSITSIQKSLTEPSASNKTEEHIVSSSTSKYPIYMWFENGTIYWWSEESNPYFNINSSNMFSYLKGLTSLDLSTFNTSNVTNMKYMFNFSGGLINLDISSFNTSNVTDMGGMFNACSSLTSLDLSNFTISSSKITRSSSLNNMLAGTSALKKLKTPSTYTANYNISLQKTMYTTAGTAFSELTSTSPTSTWLEYYSNITEFDTGQNVNQKMKRLAGNSSATNNSSDTSITSIQKSLTEPSASNKTEEHIVSSALSKYPIYMWYDNGTIYWWSECSEPFLNSQSTAMFGYLEGLTSLDLSSFNTSNVTNMSFMFLSCSSLTSLDLSSFNMSKVTSLSWMFLSMTNLTNLKTPSVYPPSDISLPKTMYDSSGTAFSYLSSTSPTSTWLYSTKP